MASNRYGAGTDVGLARDHNEDAYLVNDELGLWVVADGMGGHEAGEVASAIAVQTVNAAVARGEQLERAMNLAHRAVLKGSRRGGPGVAGMGCTCVAARLHSDAFEIAWVGDSRAYHWNGSQLVQLSHDHSYVQTLVDLGVINEQEAIDHPDRSVLTQCLGSRSVDELEVGLRSGQLKPGEWLVLCSDGLTGEVVDERIAEILADSNDEQVAVDRLIIAALENGGSDNVTVVVVSTKKAAERTGTRPAIVVEGQSKPRETGTQAAVDVPAGARPANLAAAQNAASAEVERLRRMRAASAAAAAAGRGGAAAPSSAAGAALQKQREEARRAAIGKQPRPRRLRKAEPSWLMRLLFMRISPELFISYLGRRMRERRREMSRRFGPLGRRFALLEVVARRAVLALGLAVISLGVAGGVVHSSL